jgi:integrase
MIRVRIRSKGADRPLLLYFKDPISGREVSRSAGTSDRSEAERAAALWEQELRQHRGDHDDSWFYFRQRFAEEQLAMLSKAAKASYKTALNHFERIAKPTRASDATPSVLSIYQATLLKEKRPLTSISNYLTHLRSALNWAEKIGMIHKAPKFNMPRMGRRRFMRGRPLTEAELQMMLDTAPAVCGAEAAAYQRFMELMWLTGMRLSEAMICSWTSPPIKVNLDALPYPHIVYLIEGHKSRADNAVPMCPDFAEWLKRTPESERTGLVAPVPLATSPRVSDIISAIGEQANIVVNDKGKFASAHDFRRSFGTRWAPHVRPLTLQRLMRHADIQTTLTYYVGLSSADAGAELWGSSVPSNVPKTKSRRKSAK